MRFITGCGLFLGVLLLSSAPVAAKQGAKFSVTEEKATGGTKTISANGTYTCPDTHEVIGAVLSLNRVDGGANPTPPIIGNAQGGTWSVTNAAAPAGTYDVYAKFTFRKKNPGIGDVAFEVASNVVVNVTISP